MRSAFVLFRGVEFEVSYHYHPGDRQVQYYPDGSGYPGSPPDIEIEKIEYMGADFTEVLGDNIDEIESLVWEDIANSDDI